MQAHPLLTKARLLSRSVLEISPQSCVDVGTCQLQTTAAQTPLKFVHLQGRSIHSHQHKLENNFLYSKKCTTGMRETEERIIA